MLLDSYPYEFIRSTHYRIPSVSGRIAIIYYNRRNKLIILPEPILSDHLEVLYLAVCLSNCLFYLFFIVDRIVHSCLFAHRQRYLICDFA